MEQTIQPIRTLILIVVRCSSMNTRILIVVTLQDSARSHIIDCFQSIQEKMSGTLTNTSLDFDCGEMSDNDYNDYYIIQ